MEALRLVYRQLLDDREFCGVYVNNETRYLLLKHNRAGGAVDNYTKRNALFQPDRDEV